MAARCRAVRVLLCFVVACSSLSRPFLFSAGQSEEGLSAGGTDASRSAESDLTSNEWDKWRRRDIPSCPPKLTTPIVVFVDEEVAGEKGNNVLRTVRRVTYDSLDGDTCSRKCILAVYVNIVYDDGVRFLQSAVQFSRLADDGWNEQGNSTLRFSLPRALLVGGDGTVGLFLEKAAAAGINMQHVIVGILAVGTGSDLSHDSGLKNYLSSEEFLRGKRMEVLRKLKFSLDKKYDSFDLTWEGGLLQPVGQDGTYHDFGRMHKIVLCHFGIGVLASLGMKVEFQRRDSSLGDDLEYMKMAITSKDSDFKPLNEILDKIVGIKPDGSEDIIAMTSPTTSQVTRRPEEDRPRNVLKEGKGLEFLNINTSMGGIDVSNVEAGSAFQSGKLEKFTGSPSDQKLEMFFFPSLDVVRGFKVARNGILRGIVTSLGFAPLNAGQIKPPFKLMFKPGHEVHLHMDGKLLASDDLRELSVKFHTTVRCAFFAGDKSVTEHLESVYLAELSG